MQTKIKWLDGVRFAAESGSGHTLVTDGPPDFGGSNIGARPMELVLMGLGSCAAFDVTTILQKMLRKNPQPFTDLQVEIEAERADTVPAVFTKIHMHFVVTAAEHAGDGQILDENMLARAVSLSVDKYCSVAQMLKAGGVEVVYDYKLENVCEMSA